ncbi:hypothetical protein [Flectobacillus roseus]|uniref:hypothetical protein n=1 Tax=Flectobacillus roseus TaxID=502259 RepID=UPI0024B6F251|nr:hypothetical protein [Flectobacillus roseus]MDI9870578.1 hypothetical protein [Flectobacillus roseus]
MFALYHTNSIVKLSIDIEKIEEARANKRGSKNYKVVNTIREITAEDYYEALEVVKPAFHSGFVFALGEPLHHIIDSGKYKAVFECYFQKEGRYFTFISTLDQLQVFYPSDVDLDSLDL